jgi:GNAT superfamily N-acetyltransferase
MLASSEHGLAGQQMPRETPSYSSAGLSIDAFREKDLPVFRELLDELVQSLHQTDIYAVQDDQLRQAFFSDPPQMEAIIARYKGEPAGLATWVEGFHLVRGSTIMSFEYLYVRPKFRSYAVAMAMLIYLVSLARYRGYIRIEGFVEDWNDPVAAFYRSFNATEANQTAYRLDLSKIDWRMFRRVFER